MSEMEKFFQSFRSGPGDSVRKIPSIETKRMEITNNEPCWTPPRTQRSYWRIYIPPNSQWMRVKDILNETEFGCFRKVHNLVKECVEKTNRALREIEGQEEDCVVEFEEVEAWDGVTGQEDWKVWLPFGNGARSSPKYFWLNWQEWQIYWESFCWYWSLRLCIFVNQWK